MSLEKSLPQDHSIPLTEARQMINRFRSALPTIFQPAYIAALPFSETFNKTAFETLCQQAGSVAIRAYYGLDDNRQIRLIFVPVYEEGSLTHASVTSQPAIFEFGQRCPPICGGSDPVNPNP